MVDVGAARPDRDVVKDVPRWGRKLGELLADEFLARIDPAVCEGDRQLEVGRAENVEAVVADVAERTLRSGR